MSKLLTPLEVKAKEYFNLNNEEKEQFLRTAYETEKLSWPEIAKMVGTYTNRISRDATKFNIQTRTRSDAQKLALDSGTAIHPTAGKERSIEEKIKIGKAMTKNWEEMSDDERRKRCEKSKELWDAMTIEEKENLKHLSAMAIRETADFGSKLEKFIQNGLINAGYRVEYHKEQFLQNTRLQIDLYLPEYSIAIEIDGPSHLKPVWGQEAFERTIKADNLKNGLLIGSGFYLIRVQQKKRLSLTYKNELLNKVLDVLNKIKSNQSEKLIII